MIDINLVPEQLRKKRRAPIIVENTGGLPKEVIIGIVGSFTVLLIVIFLVFQGYLAVRIAIRNNLKGQLAAIDKEKQNVDNVIKEMKSLKDRARTLEAVVAPYAIFWAEKINEISNVMPRSIWLSKVALEGDFLIIEGSAVSKLKTEIADIHSFTGKLKSNDAFMNSLKNLDLEMIKTRNVDSLSVADFKIKAQIAE